jgi:glutathione synthase/RimK-type ligase-like ATP-grasp enzyme
VTRVALATYTELPNLNDDDRLLIGALAALGVSAQPAVWDAPEVRWDGFGAVVIRSCWDYHQRLPEFLAWVMMLERLKLPVWNRPDLVRWNSHKGYLRDLARGGVATVPTHWLKRGERAALGDVLGAEGWPAAVVKPAVSASAHGTWRTSLADAARDQARLDALLAHGDAMVQPYLDEVRDPGEWSLIYFGGRFSHAVLQRPARGDFRVQVAYGGTAVARDPPRQLIADAGAVLATLPAEPLYARIDGVERGGHLVLSELELIEPHLFLQTDAAAAPRLAGALAAALGAL